MRELVEADWIDQDRRFSTAAAWRAAAAPGAGEVTTGQDAAGGCDGVKTGRFGFHVASGEMDPWWQVDLGRAARLDRVVIYNRTDCDPRRTRHVRILVADSPQSPRFQEVYRHDGETFYGWNEREPLVVPLGDKDVTARVVRLQVPGQCSFALDEVEVYGFEDPGMNLALHRPADQKSVSPYSHPGTRGHKVELPTAPEKAEFRLAHTRTVLERGRGLAARIRGRAEPEGLGPLLAELGVLERRLEALRAAGDVPESARREVYLDARRLIRRIAFTNPLLDIEEILFVKRPAPDGLFHMVHQYYGFSATPGGGLFVLSEPFSDRPTLKNLLAGAAIESGRLAGRPLVPGAFLSPEVSFDGRTVLFAYSQTLGKKPEWSPRASYHIFRASADGTGLTQLTDGPWNDFDPCFLPDGRVVFVSERRGGYLRCGGSSPPWDSPTYTLHRMDADGSNVVCLSFHETHEWHPSVDHNGMLVYTRWDYVDRDTNVAHHIWSCYPDGRDPRSFHGNYPRKRESRPWMEMSIRAIPGSHRYAATAAAHHGHAFGSLVTVDYRIEDDGAMSQVARLTPDVPFPESEGGKPRIRQHMVFGTPWPLSEDNYLCAYAADAKNHGIYWIDRFGNRELLYRDLEIPCVSPIPLRPRPEPPRLPSRVAGDAPRASAEDGSPCTGSIGVMNVYDSDFAWPPGTRITALRIIQVLPKTTAAVNRPRVGVAPETNARAVLGTVPVEPDGSAYFEAPAGKLLYFQALDERRMAVQSMRSGTYLHPGERLVCQGCHERKHTAPHRSTVPLALRRAPSEIRPDAEGSNPFNYPRLVQPVLDRHCVGCHQEKKALDLTGVADGPHGWTRSYANLAGRYGSYFSVGNGTINAGVHGGSRTVPGRFGARAAPLLEYLGESHYGVRLPDEDFHRVTLWLDANSEFFGAYHDTAAQARGEIVRPKLD
jgi:hypothetical protein